MNTRHEPVSDPSALGALFDDLAAAPHAHDFFHALRRIESMTPMAPRLGRALRPSLEPVRLGQDPELDFAPASLVSLRTQTHAPPRLGVRFLGLFGPQGPLPLHLTEYARERERHHADPGFARFADLFHHRLLSLFYRAWAEAQPTVHADRPGDDQFAKWVGALFGIAPAAFRERDAVPDAAKRFHAGTLSRGVKNAEGLETVLREHLRVPVRVQSFVGHWMRLRPQDCTQLGVAASARLGRSAVAGSKVWDRQYKFRVCVGPLSWGQYEAFLPGGTSLVVLRDWVRQFAGLERQWDLRLALKAGEVPRARLASHRDVSSLPAARLGLSTWLGGAPRRSHPVVPAKAGTHADRSMTRVDPGFRRDDRLAHRDDLILHPERH